MSRDFYLRKIRNHLLQPDEHDTPAQCHVFCRIILLRLGRKYNLLLSHFPPSLLGRQGQPIKGHKAGPNLEHLLVFKYH